MSKIKYKNPTLAEAIFELRFPDDSSWGMSSFIKFANLAAKEGFTEVVDAKQTGFEIQFSPTGENLSPKVIPSTGRIQTWNSEKTQLWQAAANLYAANRREPYLGWGKFLPHIKKGFSLYCQAANKKRQAESMIITYINKIRIEIDDKPENYLTFIPPQIKFAEKIATFACQSEQWFSDGDKININVGREIPPPNENFDGLSIVLNITYIKVKPSLQEAKLSEEIEKAHSRIINAFELSITSIQRERMEAI